MIATTALTGITPVLVSETSSANHRGGFLGYVFVANCELNREPLWQTLLIPSRPRNICRLLALLRSRLRQQRILSCAMEVSPSIPVFACPHPRQFYQDAAG
jgi:hypothetical protein